MNSTLGVQLFGHPMGRLEIRGPLRSPEDWSFRYDADWLAEPRAMALSLSMPLQSQAFLGARVRNWFCNLLPEGAVRDAIVARLRLPERDDFALLAAIGGECAGAVSVRPEGAVAPAADSGDADLDTLLSDQTDFPDVGGWSLLAGVRRLSLAGAQDKVPVVREPDGRLRLPGTDEPSTHIIKPESPRFAGLRDLEALGLSLARAVGLPAALAMPLRVAGRPALLVERYDRHRSADGLVRRRHQEDFCQALGYPGELKYEAHGGPTLAACADLVRRHALGAASLQALLDWVVFNALIGNADAHGKNLALLCDEQGRRRIAPYYDLVPTIVWPERLLDRAPALRIGQASRMDAITADDWAAFAKACGYAPRFVLRRVAQLAELLLARLPETVGTLAANGANPTHLARGGEVIRLQAQGIARRAR